MTGCRVRSGPGPPGAYEQGGSWRTSFTLANSGLIMGSTIWSMHFIAMMAVSVPVPVNYGMVETIASICIAIAATGTGLYLTGTRKLAAGAFRSAACSWDLESPACTISA